MQFALAVVGCGMVRERGDQAVVEGHRAEKIAAAQGILGQLEAQLGEGAAHFDVLGPQARGGGEVG